MFFKIPLLVLAPLLFQPGLYIAMPPKEMLFSSIGGFNKIYSEVLSDQDATVRCDLECARICHKNPLCHGFNIISGLAGLRCQPLASIPTFLESGLTFHPNGTYWEKLCQRYFNLTAAATSNEKYTTKVMARPFNQQQIYQINFDEEFNIDNITFHSDLPISVGGVNAEHTVTMWYISQNKEREMTLYVTGDNQVKCEETSDCLGEWPKSLNEFVFGKLPVKAVISKLSKHDPGLYVFGYQRVTQLDFNVETSQWSLHSSYHRENRNPENQWFGAPEGIIAASWIRDKDPNVMSDPHNVFLATRQEFYIMNFTSKTIVKRGQVCQDMIVLNN